jgi:adiponectin receptor
MENGQMHLLLLMGLLYGIGVSFFITRFPECVWPGKFDLLFHSHQIFHIFVVAAGKIAGFRT